MKNLFPSTPSISILKEEGSIYTVFTVLSKQQHDKITEILQHYASLPKSSIKKSDLNNQFYDLYKFNIYDIIADGDTKADSRLMNSIIQNVIIKSENIVKRSYKCFVNTHWEKIGIMGVPFHEDGSCSWNCLMQKLKYPKYGLIYKIDRSNLDKFNVI